MGIVFRYVVKSVFTQRIQKLKRAAHKARPFSNLEIGLEHDSGLQSIDCLCSLYNISCSGQIGYSFLIHKFPR